MKPEESVFAGKKGTITLTLVQDLIDLTEHTCNQLGMSQSDFVNAMLTTYFEKCGKYKRHSFHEMEHS